MESPTSRGESTPRIATSRSSVIESIRGCGLSGIRIGSDDLKVKLRIPDYLCRAMHDAIKQNVEQKQCYSSIEHGFAPECPIVVFINAKSGGRHGIELTEQLQELIGKDQVFDLSAVTPLEFVEYGLGCLETLSFSGDICAQEVREKLRIMVAGGDGTVGWLLSSLQALNTEHRIPIPPIGIIPLGTGNDLARSFRWGGSFPFFWKSAVKRSLDRAITGEVCHLDSWRVMVLVPFRDAESPPHTLKCTADSSSISEIFGSDGLSPEASSYYEGLFYNYFSIGMDAQIAYGFHRLRNEKPFLAQGPISNKLIYSGYGCTQGWFFTPCMSAPSLRGIQNILKMSIRKADSSEWEQISIPKSVRAIVALNLPNYASGRNPWGSPRQHYLEKRGFVGARVDDGLLEIFGLKQGWHASLVMVELISAKHMAQAAAIRLEILGGDRDHAYMQMDGEPWKQRLSNDSSFLVGIEKMPFQSLVIRGD